MTVASGDIFEVWRKKQHRSPGPGGQHIDSSAEASRTGAALGSAGARLLAASNRHHSRQVRLVGQHTPWRDRMPLDSKPGLWRLGNENSTVSQPSEPQTVRLGRWWQVMRRVMVVADDAAIRAMLVDVLRAEGYAVSEASDGLAALEELAGVHPD